MIDPFLLVQLEKNNPNFYELFFLDPDDDDISTLHKYIRNNIHVRELIVNSKKKLSDEGKETLALIEEIVNKNKATYFSNSKFNNDNKLVLNDTLFRRLIDYFNQEFDVVKPEDPEIKRNMYTLRYQTFVEEKNWRAVNNGKTHEKLEIDEYDEHSDVRVVIKKNTNKVVGAIRCILPNTSKGNNSFPAYQFKKYFICSNSNPALNPTTASIKTTEVSRIVVAREYRHNHGVVLGLIKGVIEMLAVNRVTHLYAFIQLGFASFLNRVGIFFTLMTSSFCGPEGDSPSLVYYSNTFQFMDTAYEKNRVLWEFFSAHGKYIPYKEGVHIKSAIQPNPTAGFWFTKQVVNKADSLSAHNSIELPRAKF